MSDDNSDDQDWFDKDEDEILQSFQSKASKRESTDPTVGVEYIHADEYPQQERFEDVTDVCLIDNVDHAKRLKTSTLRKVKNMDSWDLFLFVTSVPRFFVGQITVGDGLDRTILYLRIWSRLFELELRSFNTEFYEKFSQNVEFLEQIRVVAVKLFQQSYKTYWKKEEWIDVFLYDIKSLILRLDKAQLISNKVLDVITDIKKFIAYSGCLYVLYLRSCRQLVVELDRILSGVEVQHRVRKEIYPSLEELITTPSLTTKETNCLQNIEITENDVPKYIEKQKQMLRYDFITPLREFVNHIMNDENPLGLYVDVRIVFKNDFKNATKRQHHMLFIHVTASPHANDSVLASKKSIREMKTGSLLILSTSKSFKNLILATVTYTSVEILSKGYIGIKIIRQYNIGNVYDQRFLMFEAPEFFEAYNNVYSYLDNLEDGELPMKRYIVDGEKNAGPPNYLNPDVSYTYNGESFKVLNASNQSKPKELSLDPSQWIAYTEALTKEFCLIHGPPGTGKTHLSIHLVRTLIANSKTPLVFITYKNDTLDKFLLKLSAYTSNIVNFETTTEEPVNPYLKRLYYVTNEEFKTKFQIVQEMYDKFDGSEDSYQRLLNAQHDVSVVSEKLESMQLMFQFYAAKNADVIAMTSTCAAKSNFLLRLLECKIVLFEEAAEISEPHILACLTPYTEHLIMIGDHVQLHPFTSIHHHISTGHLNISLFERLFVTTLKGPTLHIQYRMRPNIADLMCPTFYEQLKNDESVDNYPNVRYMSKNLYFFDHTQFENLKHGCEVFNTFEAKEIINLAMHLIETAEYTFEDIVILSPYLQQVKFLKKQAQKPKFKSISKVNIATVDSFQGLEPNIVLLSLVRSNSRKEIGFLQSKNRICSALSRAKHGMYIIGNMYLLAERSETWRAIKWKLEAQNAIGNGFPVKENEYPQQKRFEVSTDVSLIDNVDHAKRLTTSTLRKVKNMDSFDLFLFVTTSVPSFFVGQITVGDGLDRTILYLRIWSRLFELELQSFHTEFFERFSQNVEFLEQIRIVTVKLFQNRYKRYWKKEEEINVFLYDIKSLILRLHKAQLISNKVLDVITNIKKSIAYSGCPDVLNLRSCRQLVVELDRILSGVEVQHRVQKEIYPSLKELITTPSLTTKENNCLQNIEITENDVTKYIEKQKQMLRDDFITPLRKFVNQIMNDKNPLGLYVDVRIVVKNYMQHKMPFIHVNDAVLASKMSIRKMKTGSLLILSTSKSFENLILATVTGVNKLSYIGIKIIRQYNIGNVYDQRFLMFEAPEFFEPYNNVYSYLDNLEDGELPMKRYIVDGEKNVGPPNYLNPDVSYTYNGESFKVLNASNQSKPKELSLDPSQWIAYTEALTKEFCLIQGPPGTGKTHLSIHLVRTLIANSKTPLVLVTYKNYTLDKFLLKLSAYTSNILRFGRQSRLPEIAKFNISSETTTEETVNPHLTLLYSVTNEEFKTKFQIVQEMYDKFDGSEDSYQHLLKAQHDVSVVSEKLESIRLMFQFYAAKNADVIAMTSTCAAKSNFLLRLLQCKIVVFEEATEISEPHILPCLTPYTEHVIMIGDLVQLRPFTSIPHHISNGHLKISLFERLFVTTLKGPTLYIQHRMRPNIADLLCSTFHEQLKDHESVDNYPNVRCMSKNLYFFDHTKYEDQVHGCEVFNTFEAKEIINLAMHLIETAEYTFEDIVILSPYLQQVEFLKKQARKFKSISKVNIATVDSFQGLKANIVLLSLVRSDSTKEIGFLQNKNRIYSALSCAKHGMYIIGNMSLLAERSETWHAIKWNLETQNAIGNGFPMKEDEYPQQERLEVSTDVSLIDNVDHAKRLTTSKLRKVKNMESLDLFLFVTTSVPSFFVGQITVGDGLDRTILYLRIWSRLFELELRSFHTEFFERFSQNVEFLEQIRVVAVKLFQTKKRTYYKKEEVINDIKSLILRLHKAQLISNKVLDVITNIKKCITYCDCPDVLNLSSCRQLAVELDRILSGVEMQNRVQKEIYPSLKELIATPSLTTKENNCLQNIEITENDVTKYIEKQKQMLRDDFITPLREFVNQIMNDKNPLGLYLDVRIVVNNDFKKARRHEMLFIHVTASPHANDTVLASKMSIREMKTGSLLILSTSKSFENLILATVTYTDVEILSKGYIGIKIIRQFNIGNVYAQQFLMFEAPEFFEPYNNVYSYLDNLEDGELPMKRYIVDGEKNVGPPNYLNPDVSYTYNGESFKVLNASNQSKPKELSLDPSQWIAYTEALTKEFCLIQGPPGTGKTHLSIHLVRTLIANSKTPLVLVTYKNYTLDKFLLKLSAYTSNILRFGRQSRLPEIAKFNISSETTTEETVNPHLTLLYSVTNEEFKTKFQIVQEMYDKFDGSEDSYQHLLKAQHDVSVVSEKLESIRLMFQFYAAKNADVIAMTSTCAAKSNFLLRLLQCKIVVFEEAAEISEPHILPCLTPYTEHVIMIGDLVQLRPFTSIPHHISNGHLNISLFERLFVTTLKGPTLYIQHRMRPNIADLLCSTFHEQLKDHESVDNYPNVRCMSKNLYFFDHTKYEDQVRGCEVFNIFEAKEIINLAMHLIETAEYTFEDIVILSPYLQQVEFLKKQARKRKFKSISMVNIATVDSFQGLKANIILLSLVRSNSKKDIGFLQNKNRIYSALSCAKHGMYIIGNMSLLAERSETWHAIKWKLETQNTIGNGFPVKESMWLHS